MKIYRKVNGVPMEFELTDSEKRDAYYEMEHEWDMNYVLDLAEINADESCPETIDRLNALRSIPELHSRVAYRFRKYMDDSINGDEEYSCFEWAYKYIVGEIVQNPV